MKCHIIFREEVSLHVAIIGGGIGGLVTALYHYRESMSCRI